MSKIVFIFFVLIAILFFSCKKNYPAYDMGKTMLYHIEGNDTISWVAIPNSITPDGDGINDVFQIYNNSIGLNDFYLLEVFNSNSEKIYLTEHFSDYWNGSFNGKYCPNGSYSYRLQVTDTVGYLFDYSGVIHLIR